MTATTNATFGSVAQQVVETEQDSGGVRASVLFCEALHVTKSRNDERMNGILLWIEQHPGLASWVQAIGSILAIIVAIAVANNQFRKAVKRDHNAWASRLKSIAVILRIMVDALQSMYDLQDDPHSEQRTRSLRKAFTLFQTTSLAVSKIPLEDLSSEQFAITLMSALDNISALQRSLEGALKGEMSPKELAEFKELLDSFAEYDGQLQREIQRIESM